MADQLRDRPDDSIDAELDGIRKRSHPPKLQDPCTHIISAHTAHQGTWVLFGTFCAFTFLFAFFLIPETKGMSLEKMDELFGITDDLLRIMDENQRERTASRTAPELTPDGMGLASLYTNAATLVASVGAAEKRDTGSSRSKNSTSYRI